MRRAPKRRIVYTARPMETTSNRMVFCVKFQKELEGMDYQPFDDDLGKRIYDNVSKEGWKLWLEHSKMIINEYRLDLVSPEAQQLLRDQMEKFFVGEGAALPPGYVPPQQK
jgi:Fe-S cluster biosynthesis and repair protein YggX